MGGGERIDFLVGSEIATSGLLKSFENGGTMILGNGELAVAACRCDLLEHLGGIGLPIVRQVLDFLDGVFKYLHHPAHIALPVSIEDSLDCLLHDASGPREENGRGT